MKSYFQTIKVILLAGILAVGASYVFAVGPTANPPLGNVPAPINAGSSPQAKLGTLSVGTSSLPVTGSTLDISGKLTANNLAVFGQVAIVDGTQGVGKVLTSDSNGVASWETPSASGGAPVSGLLWTGSQYINIASSTITFTHNLGTTDYYVRAYFNPTTNSKEGALQIPVGINFADSVNNPDNSWKAGLSARIYSNKVEFKTTDGDHHNYLAAEWRGSVSAYGWYTINGYKTGYLIVELVP